MCDLRADVRSGGVVEPRHGARAHGRECGVPAACGTMSGMRKRTAWQERGALTVPLSPDFRSFWDDLAGLQAR